jgi:hypothetical protein
MEHKTKTHQPIVVFPSIAHGQEAGLVFIVYQQQDHHFEKPAKQ